MSSIPLWILALVLYDLRYYWGTAWATGQCHGPRMWCTTSEYYNPSTALRQTSTGALFGWVFYRPPMAVAVSRTADAGDRGPDRPAVPVLGAH